MMTQAQTLQVVPELLESTVPKGRSASVSVGTVHSSASRPHEPPLPHGWHSLTAGVVTASHRWSKSIGRQAGRQGLEETGSTLKKVAGNTAIQRH